MALGSTENSLNLSQILFRPSTMTRQNRSRLVSSRIVSSRIVSSRLVSYCLVSSRLVDGVNSAIHTCKIWRQREIRSLRNQQSPFPLHTLGSLSADLCPLHTQLNTFNRLTCTIFIDIYMYHEQQHYGLYVCHQ